MQQIKPFNTTSERSTGTTPVVLVELLFFAYRDFVGEADRILEKYRFGRAHHRILHFVNRHPGLMVAELLTILGITKQSLARVLRDLVAGGFIEQRTGAEDRRQRLLYLTPPGTALAQELLSIQNARMMRALGALDPAQHEVIERFLLGLVEKEDRPTIARLVRQVPGGEAD